MSHYGSSKFSSWVLLFTCSDFSLSFFILHGIKDPSSKLYGLCRTTILVPISRYLSLVQFSFLFSVLKYSSLSSPLVSMSWRFSSFWSFSSHSSSSLALLHASLANSLSPILSSISISSSSTVSFTCLSGCISPGLVTSDCASPLNSSICLFLVLSSLFINPINSSAFSAFVLYPVHSGHLVGWHGILLFPSPFLGALLCTIWVSPSLAS